MSNKSFISLIEDIDKADREQRDRGTLFEILSITYLKNEPMYHKLFEEVWMLKDVPEKYNIPKVDNGVDLVAKRMVVMSLLLYNVNIIQAKQQ